MAKQKAYVVWVGQTPGVYSSWADCLDQVHGFSGAKYKAYKSLQEAEKAYRDGWERHWGQIGKQHTAN